MQTNDESQSKSSFCATGLNAHGQLGARSEGQLGFAPVCPGRVGINRVLYSSWSSTTLLTRSDVITIGSQDFRLGDWCADGQKLPNWTSAFGNEDGLIGCVDEHGDLYSVQPHETSNRDHLHKTSDERSPSIGCVAMAGNGKIAVTIKQAPNGRLCHIITFAGYEEFETWHRDPSEANLDVGKQHFMLPGRPKQLLANIATFLLLMEDGEVYSWGDSRYRSLGRSITGETAVSAERPGVLQALGGLKIEKIACGGWLSAALSADGALYLLGADMPGSKHSIRCLRETAAGEVALVDLPDGDGGSLDVIGVGVGDHHVAVLTQDKRLFVVGDNSNGQLGVAFGEEFLKEWTEVTAASEVQSVVCGPKATFIFVPSK